MILVELFIIFLMILILQHVFKMKKLTKMVNEFDGPRTIPILGNALMFLGSPKDIMRTAHELGKQFEGKTYRIWLLHKPYICVNAVEDISKVSRILTKDETYKFISDGMGEGLITAQPEKWKKSRPILNPAFNATTSAEYFLTIFNRRINKVLEKIVADVGLNKIFNIGPYISKATTCFIYETVLGVTDEIADDNVTQLEEKYLRAHSIILKRCFSPWLHPPLLFKIYTYWKGCSSIFQELRDLHRDAIQEKKKMLKEKWAAGEFDDQKKKPVFDLLLEKYDLTDHELTDEMLTLLFAGSETTAVLISFTLLMLAQHPDIQEKVYAELSQIFQSDIQYPTMEELSKLTFLEQCIKESLRKYTVIPFIARKAHEDILISGDQVIPAGAGVIVSLHDIHNSSTFYNNPDKWDPHHFDADVAASRPANAFMPFGFGPRKCIGYKYAILAAKAFISIIIRQFRITTNQKRVRLTVNFLTKCRDGYNITLDKRHE